MSTIVNTALGVDVSKHYLDVAIHDAESVSRFGNDAQGIGALLKLARTVKVDRIIVEASGGYQTELVAALAHAQLPVVVVNPRQVCEFARHWTTCQDGSDRRTVLAAFAVAVKPQLRLLVDAEATALAALLTRRQPLVQMRMAEKNRLALAATPAVKKNLKAHVQWLDRCLGDNDNDLRELIRKSPVWCEKDELLESIAGIGVHANRPTARARSPRSQGDRRTGRSCTVQSRQRDVTRSAHDLGRTT